jgi:hypothetical protein
MLSLAVAATAVAHTTDAVVTMPVVAQVARAQSLLEISL